MILLFLILLSSASAKDPDVLTGKVLRVVDGDTIKVMVMFATDIRENKRIRHYSARQTVTMRIHGIDAPEKRQAYGKVSTQFVINQIDGKVVKVLIYDHHDRYGRLVGDVEYGGKRLSWESVRAGMSWWYQQYDRKDRDLEREQMNARNQRRGLWADARPQEPWKFRKEKLNR